METVVSQSVKSHYVTPRHDQIALSSVEGGAPGDEDSEVLEMIFSCSQDAGPMKATAAQLATLFLAQVRTMDDRSKSRLAELMEGKFTITGISVKQPEGWLDERGYDAAALLPTTADRL